MAKNDEFDFGFGDELFPLDDDIFNSKAVEPPKSSGLKSYATNSIKSVGRLGIKLTKAFLPETTSLIESLKPSTDGNNASEIIKNAKLVAKSKLKEYTDIGKDTAVGLVNDFKNAVKTGNFASEQEMDLFGMDSEFGFDDTSFDNLLSEEEFESPADIATVKSAKISSKATVESAKATSQAVLSSSKKTTGAILGASQAQLKQNKSIFAQQTIIEEDRYNRKISIMKNLATNVAKLVEQNNLSIKAQMEYSMKSLAFTQDITSMLKEVRDAQWKSTGTNPNKESDFTDTRSSFSKIFSNGFDRGEYKKHLKGKFDNSMLGSMLGMAGMGTSMFSGMGMNPADMLKEQVKDQGMRMIFGNLFSGKVKDNMYSLDKLAKSFMPGLNSKLGSISRNGVETGIPWLDDIIQKGAGFMHVPDAIKAGTNKFAMGNPDDVHPFDNKAHKVLTEVIPGYLSKISAGITGKEQEFYDYTTDTFRGVESIKKTLQRNKDAVFEYTEGYSESRDFINNDSINKIGSVKGSMSKVFTTENIQKANEIILRNMGTSNIIPTASTFEYLKDPNSYERKELMKGLPFTDEENDFFFENFIVSLSDFREKRPDEFNKFVISMAEIKTNLTNVNLDTEDQMGNFGSISAYNTIVNDEKIQYEKNLLQNKINNAPHPFIRQQKLKEMRNLQDHQEGHKGFVNDIDAMGSNFELSGGTSTPNMLKNIYDLMVDGLVVYPGSMPASIRKKFKNRKNLLLNEAKALEENEKIKQEEQEERNKESLELARQAKDTQEQKLNFLRWNNDTKINEVASNLPGVKQGNEGLAGVLGRVTDWGSNMLFGTHISDEYRDANKVTNEKMKEYFDNVSNHFQRGKSSLKDKLSNFGTHKSETFDSIADKGKDLVEPIKDKIIDTTDKVKESVKDIPNKVKSINIKDSLNDTKESVKDIPNKVKSINIKDKVNNIKDTVKEKISDTKDNITEKVQKENNTDDKKINLKDLLNDTSTSIKSFINDKFKNNETVLSDNFDKVKDSLNDAKESVKDIPNKVKSINIKDKVNNIKDTVKEKISDTKENITEKVQKENESTKNKLKPKEGSYLDQENDQKEKEKEERENLIAKSAIATSIALQKLLKDGFHFNKKGRSELEDMTEEISDAAESGEGGIIDNIFGMAAGGGLSLGGIKNSAKSAFKGSKIGKAAGILGGIGGGVGKALKSIGSKVAGSGTAGKLAGSIGKNAGKAGGLATKAVGLIQKLFGGFSKNSTVVKVLGGTASKLGKVLTSITSGVVKNAPKLASKLSGFITKAAASAGTLLIITGSAGLVKGIADVRKNFGLGRGINPTAGMSIASGLAGGLDGLLAGIPGVLATIMGKSSLAAWMYELVGNSEEQQAMQLYNQYNQMRAKIYGVNPNNLVSYETRSALDKAGRGLGSILTFGLMDSNAEKDAGSLGFKSVTVFNYWKENKYQPLEDLRKEMAEPYGGLKVVDKMMGMNTEESDNKNEKLNKVLEDKRERENEAIQGSMENQNEFRKAFLKAARDWVIANDLAWLGSSTTLEEMNAKLDGNKNDTKDDETDKKTDPNVTQMPTSESGSSTDLATVASGSKTEPIAKAAAGVTGAAVAASAAASQSGVDAISGAAVTAEKTGFLKGIGNTLSNAGSKIIQKVKDILSKLFESKIINAVVPVKLLSSISNTIIKGLSKPEVINSEVIGESTKRLLLTLVPGATVAMGIAGFLKGKTRAAELFGISGKATSGMTSAAAVTEAINSALMGVPDIIAKKAYGKKLLYLVYDIVGEKAELDSLKLYQEFNAKRATIYGVDVNKLLEYESKINVGKNIFKMAKNLFTNLFSGGAARADAKLLGFKSKKVFEYWRDRKFNPLNDLKKEIALEFGNDKDLDDIECKKPDVQKRYRESFLKEAESFVNKNGLRWLTAGASESDLDKNKTKLSKGSEEEDGDASKVSFGDSIKNFFSSSNTETDFNKSVNASGSGTMTQEERDELNKKIQSQSDYSNKTTNIISSATSSIKGFFEDIIKSDPEKSSETVTTGNTTDAVTYKDTTSTTTTPTETKTDTTTSTPVTPPSTPTTTGTLSVDNGPMFEILVTKTDEMITKLNILDSILSENKRHNELAETYFASALQLLGSISNNTGKSSIPPNEIDELSRMLSQG